MQTLGGFIAGGGLSLIFLRTTKRKLQSEADQAAAEADAKEWKLEEDRINNLHNSLMTNNETIAKLTSTVDSLTARLSTLNATVDKHIDRNREISDRLYKSERDLNISNDKIISLTVERDNAMAKAEYYRNWRCERNDCQDPRGPLPPERTRIINGLTYKDPTDNDYIKERKPRRGSKEAATKS